MKDFEFITESRSPFPNWEKAVDEARRLIETDGEEYATFFSLELVKQTVQFDYDDELIYSYKWKVKS